MSVVVLAASCTPRPPSLPSGRGAPFPGFQAAYVQAVAGCRDVRTLTLSMALSGRARSSRMRGRIDAGFAAPDRARLEGLAPFGKPVFILVAARGRGTLVIVREDRVLRDAPVDQIVEALAGVPLDAAALKTVVSGCGFGGPAPPEGRLLADGWASASTGGGVAYLRRSGDAWRMAAETRGALTVIYADFTAGRPSTVRLRAETGGQVMSDLTLRLSDVEMNATLDPKTFDITPDLPAHAVPMTLEELRRSGPLGER